MYIFKTYAVFAVFFQIAPILTPHFLQRLRIEARTVIHDVYENIVALLLRPDRNHSAVFHRLDRMI
ncbi:hypothetical protein D3C77_749530 [compost metagenome]